MNKYLDKICHGAICFIISLVGTLFFNWWIGLILAVLAGILKEVYDAKWGTGWDWYDVIADGIGLILGLGAYLVYILVRS